MNIKKVVRPYHYLRSKLALRMWAAILLLSLFGVAFVWLVQIRLFEINYIDAAMTELENRVIPVAREVQDIIGDGRDPLSFLSKSTNGKVFLVDKSGEILFAYSSGLPIQLDDGDAGWVTKQIEKSYQRVLAGETIREIGNKDKHDSALSFGASTTYRGESAAIFAFNSLSEIQTMQELNRKQLLMLSIALTLVASLLAPLFTRQFTKPILKIKATVDLLAQGDLSATPRLVRHDELGQLSHSVEELGTALQRVDVLRKEVIANVSHELRAPLSLIIGYSEMVRDITWTDEERRKNNLDLIIRESERLSQMVDDIMDYSQLQAGYAKLNRAVCNLYEIVEQEVALGQQAAREFGIQILLDSFSQETPADVDALKISQVIRNLLNNAVNHTADGENVNVSVTKSKEGIRVAVANPGEPIPEEDRELIWERYRRAQHQGGRRQGTGIGLAIVSTILAAHDMPYGVECTDKENIFWFVA